MECEGNQEIDGVLNHIKLESQTRVSGLIYSGDVAEPDESEDLKSPTALGETDMHQNVNDSLITPRVITHPPSEAYERANQVSLARRWFTCT